MAVKCVNCANDAQFTESDPRFNPVNYCSECLPPWLRDRANAGHFPLVEDAPVAETKSKSKKKAAEAPVEEPVVEETPAPEAE